MSSDLSVFTWTAAVLLRPAFNASDKVLLRAPRIGNIEDAKGTNNPNTEWQKWRTVNK